MPCSIYLGNVHAPGSPPAAVRTPGCAADLEMIEVSPVQSHSSSSRCKMRSRGTPRPLDADDGAKFGAEMVMAAPVAALIDHRIKAASVPFCC